MINKRKLLQIFIEKMKLKFSSEVTKIYAAGSSIGRAEEVETPSER